MIFPVAHKGSKKLVNSIPIMPMSYSFWKATLFVSTGLPVLAILCANSNSKVVPLVVPWIAIFVIYFLVIWNFYPHKSKNNDMYLKRPKVLEADGHVVPEAIFSFARSLGTCFKESKVRVPVVHPPSAAEMVQRAFLPDQFSVVWVVIKALLEKLQRWKGLAYALFSSSIAVRCITHFLVLGGRLRRFSLSSTASAFAT